jgi:hypothetical protein
MAEISVTFLIFHQKDQVGQDVVPRLLGSVPTGALGQVIDFGTQDGMNPLFLRLLIKLKDPKEVDMVRHRHRLHSELFDLCDQAVDRDSPMKKAVLRMNVKMNEILGIHFDEIYIPYSHSIVAGGFDEIS